MQDEGETTLALSNAIRDGTYPESTDLLISELSNNAIPTLLKSVASIRDELSHDISKSSRKQSRDVDEWIVQAKKVQEDIERCKLDARQIVEYHKRVEAFKAEVEDSRKKVKLLNAEISFTETLDQELSEVKTVSEALRQVDSLLQQNKAPEAAAALGATEGRISNFKGPRVAAILRELGNDLRWKIHARFEEELNTCIVIEREKDRSWLEIKPNASGASLDELLLGLEQIQALDAVAEAMTERIEGFILHTMRSHSKIKLSSYNEEQEKLLVEFGSKQPEPDTILNYVRALLTFLHSHLPPKLQQPLSEKVIPKLISTLISGWMTPAIPFELSKLQSISTLQQKATELGNLIESFGWNGHGELHDWVDHVPRLWLAKRKAETLNSVRKAFILSQGIIRQVERTEQQVVSNTGDLNVTNDESEDWDTNWDEEEDTTTGENNDAATEDDEDTSGWGFDDNDGEPTDQQPAHNGTNSQDDEDEGDAWGWDDESPTEKRSEAPNQIPMTESKVPQQKAKTEQVVTLTELYSISDVPDYLIEAIGKDIQDAYELQENTYDALGGIPAAQGLLALPTLALAMFRATAPTSYSTSGKLGNMNLYNDALYILQKLKEMNPPPGMQNIEGDCRAIEKFAKSAYAREMEIQRTILGDLLDGAQGFTSCTKFPYSQEIENAVSGTVERIRIIHQEWKPILSTSALLQSIGALLSTVISKTITDIEEMDDISEPESQRLVSFCAQVTALEDVFIAKPPGAAENEAESVPMTAVYVSNWLKFQYLINILESSLVDIKFLWTEGELSLEFSSDEVIDLIKALFAESPHRRNAIAAIREHQGSPRF